MTTERPPLLCPLPRRSTTYSHSYYSPHPSYQHSYTYSYAPTCAPPSNTRSRRTPSLSGGRPGSVVVDHHQRRRGSSVSKGPSPPVMSKDGGVGVESTVSNDEMGMIRSATPSNDEVLSEFLSLFTPSSPSPSPTTSFHPSLQPLPPASAPTAATATATATVGPLGLSCATPTPRSSRSSSSSNSHSNSNSQVEQTTGPILVPISSVLPLPRTFSASPSRSRRYIPSRPRSRLANGNGCSGAEESSGVGSANGNGAKSTAHYAWLLGSPISRCRAPAPRAEVELADAAAAFAALNLRSHSHSHPCSYSPQQVTVLDLYSEPSDDLLITASTQDGVDETNGRMTPVGRSGTPSSASASTVGVAATIGRTGSVVGRMRMASSAIPLSTST